LSCPVKKRKKGKVKALFDLAVEKGEGEKKNVRVHRTRKRRKKKEDQKVPFGAMPAGGKALNPICEGIKMKQGEGKENLPCPVCRY